MLAPGGALLVSTPQWQRPELRPFHVREYRGTELAHMLGEHFGRVRVQASEPGRLQDLYPHQPPTRIAVNLLSQAGTEPFRVRRSPTDERAGWRQLVAIADFSAKQQHARAVALLTPLHDLDRVEAGGSSAPARCRRA